MPLALEAIDYKNLLNYIDIPNRYLLISDIVIREFCDYFSNEELFPKIDQYQKLVRKFKQSPYLPKISYPDLESEKFRALSNFKQKLVAPTKKIISTVNLSSDEVIDFLIKNKRTNKAKENLRDYFLFKSIQNECHQEEGSEIIFITRDKIFTESKDFNALIPVNLKIFSSIAEFLQAYGFKLDFLTPELVLSYFKDYNFETILQPFAKDFFRGDSFLTNNLSALIVDQFDVKFRKIKNLYSYKDISSSKYYFVTHLTVIVYVSFILEEYSYRNYIWGKEPGRFYSSDDNDTNFSDIFEDEVDLVFSGELDTANEEISECGFEYYLY